MCHAENPAGSKFCNGCGGRFTGSGIQFAGAGSESGSYRDPQDVERDKVLREYGEAHFVARWSMAPVVMLFAGVMGSIILLIGLLSGSGRAMLTGAFLLVMCAVLVAGYLRSARRYPWLFDSDDQVGSTGDEDELDLEKHRARLRR